MNPGKDAGGTGALVKVITERGLMRSTANTPESKVYPPWRAAAAILLLICPPDNLNIFSFSRHCFGRMRFRAAIDRGVGGYGDGLRAAGPVGLGPRYGDAPAAIGPAPEVFPPDPGGPRSSEGRRPAA